MKKLLACVTLATTLWAPAHAVCLIAVTEGSASGPFTQPFSYEAPNLINLDQIAAVHIHDNRMVFSEGSVTSIAFNDRKQAVRWLKQIHAKMEQCTLANLPVDK